MYVQHPPKVCCSFAQHANIIAYVAADEKIRVAEPFSPSRRFFWGGGMFSSPQARNLSGCFRRSIASLYNHFYNCSSHFEAKKLGNSIYPYGIRFRSLKRLKRSGQNAYLQGVFSGVS